MYKPGTHDHSNMSFMGGHGSQVSCMCRLQVLWYSSVPAYIVVVRIPEFGK